MFLSEDFYVNQYLICMHVILIKLSLFQPTARAKLGSKALKFLKKGRPVDDQIVVDVITETIR